MKNVRKAVLGALAAPLLFVASGCYGSFKMTCDLHHWNGEATQDRWLNEFIFVVISPAYAFCTVADAVALNAIERWSGKHPMDPAEPKKSEKKSQAPRRIVNGDEVIAISQSPEGDALTIEHSRAGEPARSVRIERHGDVALATAADGSILYTAQRTPEGGLVVADDSGVTVATFSAAELR